MDIIDIPRDLAFSTRRPWGQWADGRWRRVVDVDDQSYLRFRQALHSWASRNGRATATNRADNGDMIFQISVTLRGAHRADLSDQFVIWSFPDGGWLYETPAGELEYVKNDVFKASRFTLGEALSEVGERAHFWDRAQCPMPPLMAVALADLPENPTPWDLQASVAVPAVLVLALLGGDQPETDNPFVAEIVRRAPKGDAR